MVQAFQDPPLCSSTNIWLAKKKKFTSANVKYDIQFIHLTSKRRKLLGLESSSLLHFSPKNVVIILTLFASFEVKRC
jgi:hypothetical protein